MKKVIVGMSGGVDSSVAALLLVQQGYDVTGVFMKNWEEDDTATYCAAAADLQDAQQVCDKLGIELKTINFASEYWDYVFEDFLDELKQGRTPNPDILCNSKIKFAAFLDYAQHLGADYIATGHYAAKELFNNQYILKKGVDKTKDQSYFLYRISQGALKKTIFPLGKLEKTKIRQIAKQHNFINHNKKDSVGICFIGERNFNKFIDQYLPAVPGEIVTEQDQIIGQHSGLMHYTIGQRQGLAIGGHAQFAQKPWFVAKKDLAKNKLIVVQGGDHPSLLRQDLVAINPHWIADEPQFPLHCMAKTRYRQQDQKCIVEQDSQNNLSIKFAKPQRAITAGQAIVFYENTYCLGGATIQ
jgi:tRNA-specific 2-thiouridylase